MSGSQGLPPVGAMLTVDGEMNVVLRHVDAGNGPVALWGPADGGFAWSVTTHSHALTLAWREQQARVNLEAKIDAIDAAGFDVCRDNDAASVIGAAEIEERRRAWDDAMMSAADAISAMEDAGTLPAEVGAAHRGLQRAGHALVHLNRALVSHSAQLQHSHANVLARLGALEWAIVRTLYAGDIDPPNPTAPFWFREQLLKDAGLTMERCRELMDLHRGEDRVARL